MHVTSSAWAPHENTTPTSTSNVPAPKGTVRGGVPGLTVSETPNCEPSPQHVTSPLLPSAHTASVSLATRTARTPATSTGSKLAAAGVPRTPEAPQPQHDTRSS